MREFYLLVFAIMTTSVMMAQLPTEHSIPAWYLETDDTGRFYGAFGKKILVFNDDGIISDTITTDFNESFGQITDFRIGLDGKMYLLFDFNNGIYEVDATGHVTKILSGRFRHFDVDQSGGILASIENGAENILRYVNAGIDTTFILDDNISASNLVFDVQIDDNNTFWIAYAKGLLSITDVELTRHNEESISDLFVSDDGRIYVSYNNTRVGYKEANMDAITPIDFNDAVGRNICGDSDGRIYVSEDNKVHIFSEGSWNTIEISNSIFINAVDFVVDAQNTVVMSTNQGRMFIWTQDSSSSKEETLGHTIRVFPNPARDFLSVTHQNNLAPKSNYRIIAIDGNTVQSGLIEAQGINVMHLPKGIYSLYLESSGISIKFVKS